MNVTDMYEGTCARLYYAFPKRLISRSSTGRRRRRLCHLSHLKPPFSRPSTYADHNCYYLILDLVTGGEMFEHLIHYGAYSEADAARLMYEIASALAFLHGVGVVHADLKPEVCIVVVGDWSIWNTLVRQSMDQGSPTFLADDHGGGSIRIYSCQPRIDSTAPSR